MVYYALYTFLTAMFLSMIITLFRHIRAGISLSLMLINTIIWTTPLFIVAFLKFIVPVPMWRKGCSQLLIFFATSFIAVNSWVLRYISGVKIELDLEGNLEKKRSYLVVCNHQSYADIIVLQKVLNYRIPFLKFFLKQQLIWIPVFGLAWWALDFPFMKRFSKEYLKKHPEDAGKDFKATQKACEKFKGSPVSIMNFVEGTRFTPEKKQRQNSPYRNLLKPKAGGVGYVLSLLGNQIHHLVNVTINYPTQQLSLWRVLGGWIPKIKVTVEVLDIPDEVKVDYRDNPENRIKIQRWLNGMWQEKDKTLHNRFGNSEQDT